MKRRIISIFLSVLILCTIVSCAASPSRSLTLESLEQYVLDQVLSFSALEHETNSWNETTEIKDYITLYAPDDTINGYIFHFETNGQDTGFMQISILNRDPHIVNLGFTGNDVLSSMVSHHNNLAVENSRSFEHITLSSSESPKVYYTGGFNYYIESSSNQLISLSRNEVIENDLSELLSEYDSYLLFYDGSVPQ